jgi:hypothetical protein
MDNFITGNIAGFVSIKRYEKEGLWGNEPFTSAFLDAVSIEGDRICLDPKQAQELAAYLISFVNAAKEAGWEERVD